MPESVRKNHRHRQPPVCLYGRSTDRLRQYLPTFGVGAESGMVERGNVGFKAAADNQQQIAVLNMKLAVRHPMIPTAEIQRMVIVKSIVFRKQHRYRLFRELTRFPVGQLDPVAGQIRAVRRHSNDDPPQRCTLEASLTAGSGTKPRNGFVYHRGPASSGISSQTGPIRPLVARCHAFSR